MTMMEPYETATPPVVRALTIAATDAVIVPAPANGRDRRRLGFAVYGIELEVLPGNESATR